MTAALSVRDLRKVYDGGVVALKGVDLDVPEGDFFALLGPNGAGKSTLIGIVSSLVNKSSGQVSVHGLDLDREPAAVKASIGLVPQEFNFNGFEAIFDTVTNVAGYNGLPRRIAHERAERYLRQLDLWGKRRTKARELSGGMKRRLMIARALVHEPKLLILDEPTAGVDIEIRRSMWEFLERLNREQGTTIILTTHYLEEAESLCRHVAIIDDGEIVERGRVSQLLSQAMIETFVLDIDGPLPDSLPTMAPFDLRRRDDDRLEADVPKGHSVNEMFEALSRHELRVTSLRNKSNRLEEFFMRLVRRHGRGGDDHDRDGRGRDGNGDRDAA